MYPKIKSKIIDPYFWTTQFDTFFNGFIFAHAYLQSRRAARIPRGGSMEKNGFFVGL